MIGTLVGSWPGEDVREALRVAVDTTPDLLAVPELPARGVSAQMVGRTGALLAGLGLDLQPAGWRLTDAAGVDHRRARSLLAADLDVVEEELQAFTCRLKTQVVGPWTLAAAVERPRGDKVLADHGARRELAESLAEGIADHLADLRRRVPGVDLVVQVDEPSLPTVLAGAVRTASGFSRHRTVDAPEADRLLRLVADAIDAAGATPVLHSCAPGVPLALVHGAGYRACSFDLGLIGDRETETWAAAVDAGLVPWPGVVPSTEPAATASVSDLSSRVARFLDAVDADPADAVVTPACGLAGATPAWARRAATLTRDTAAAASESLAG